MLPVPVISLHFCLLIRRPCRPFLSFIFSFSSSVLLPPYFYEPFPSTCDITFFLFFIPLIHLCLLSLSPLLHCLSSISCFQSSFLLEYLLKLYHVLHLSGKNPQLWLQKYAADNLRFVEFERKALPCALMRPSKGKPSLYRWVA